MTEATTTKRGFAALPAERRSEIAKMGAAASGRNGTRRKWTPEEARAAAIKGAQMKRAKQNGTSQPASGAASVG